MRILHIGPRSGTSLDRANAYRRLGHEVTHIETRMLLPATPWTDRITWHLGDIFLSGLMLYKLKNALKDKRFDYCHVDGSEWLGPGAVKLLKKHCSRVINYNIDDPTGHRDRKRFICYRRAVPEYDLLCVVRSENIAEVRNLGARAVICVRRSADEQNHAPRTLSDADMERWASDVLFLGTWMPERGPFLAKLVELGVPLTIRGARWHRAPEWPVLQKYWKGDHLVGDDYAKAIQCAKVNIGLLSEGNRDQHTTRSAEIPALGGLFCAKRTSDHQEMYVEGEEAVFWESPEECATRCLGLLSKPSQADAIRKAGALACRKRGYFNENVCRQLIDASDARTCTTTAIEHGTPPSAK